MANPETPNTAAAPSGTGESLTVAEAAQRIEGLLGPAFADKPKPKAAAPSYPPEPPEEGADADPDPATQPEEGDAEAEDTAPADENAEAAPAEAEQQPDLIEVTLPGGEKDRVTLAELRRGYSRHADYTRAKQAHAEAVRSFDAVAQQAQQVIRIRLDTLQTELDRLIPSEDSIDWEALRAKDAANHTQEFTYWKEHFRDFKDKRQAVAHEQAQIAYHEQQRQAYQSVETLKREYEALTKRLPVFADAVKGDKVKAEVHDYLLSKGYRPEELAMLSDHRSVDVAWDAARWRKYQASKPAIDKRVAHLPRVQKPGAAVEGEAVSRQKVTALTEKLRKTGRPEDAARLILARMH